MSNGFPGPAPGAPGPAVPIWPPADKGHPDTRRAVGATLRWRGADVIFVANDQAETTVFLRMRAPQPEIGDMYWVALGYPETFPKHPQEGEFLRYLGDQYTIFKVLMLPGRAELELRKQ